MKHFNTEGVCRPDCHYMVKTDDNLAKIKSLIDRNKYIVLNRPRQFGKSTTLDLLQKVLEPQYAYVKTSLERFPESAFTEDNFCEAIKDLFIDYFEREETGLSEEAKTAFISTYEAWNNKPRMLALVRALRKMFKASDKRVVLAIDEIDHAENHEVFFEFLNSLRSEYNDNPANTFQSVILVGVSEINHLINKARPEAQSLGMNRSPWNIAVSFGKSMDLPNSGIFEMLEEYKADHGLKFDAARMSDLLFEYTSGYPFLVSKLCYIIHSKLLETERFADLDAAWTREGFLAALQILMSDRTVPLFQSLAGQLEENKELITLTAGDCGAEDMARGAIQ
ncbi:MAG: AAA family ATPase [Clostridiales bacterium]|nr:AAA family ATPase [Clostridiales bacterium]